MENKLTIHYLDFIGEYGGIITTEEIINGKFTKKLKITEKDYTIITHLISHKDIDTKFFDTVARLYIPSFQGKEEILIDREGRVRKGKTEYLISPFYFLKLSYFMDYLKFQNGDMSGIPHFKKDRY